MNTLTKDLSGRRVPTKKYTFSLPIDHHTRFRAFCKSLRVGTRRTRSVGYSKSECAATGMRLFMALGPDKARGVAEALFDDAFWRKVETWLRQFPDPGQ